MKKVMKRALALMVGLVTVLGTVGTNVAYAAPSHKHGDHSHSSLFTKPHAHIYNRAVTEKWTEATCESFATQTWACSQYVTKNGKKVLCEEEITITTGFLRPHNYVSTATEEHAGVYKCACGAVEYTICNNCVEYRLFGRYHIPHIAVKVAPKLQHTHVVVEDAAVDATCSNSGLTAGSHCESCGKVLVAQQEVAMKEHNWNVTAEYVYCTMEGERHYKCTECKAYKSEVVEAAGHSWTTVAEQAPTCTEEGHYEYSVCTTCGYSTKPMNIIDATGHDVVKLEAVEATCTSTGLTEGEYCATCGEVLIEQQEVPMKEHDWNMTAEYVYCTMKGERHFKCADCKAYKSEEVEPVGHSWTTVEEKAPTCTEDGHYEYSLCTRCGYNTKPMNIIDAIGHDVVKVEGVEATCTLTGLTEGEYCATCGEILVEQQVIPVKEHNWKVIKEYSYCAQNGIRYVRCTECKVNEEEVVAPTGHSWTTVAAKEPTCTEDGHYEYSLCSKCGYSTKSPYDVIPATGHKEVVIPGKEAVGTTHGWSEGSYCETCNEVLVEREETCKWVEEDGYAECPGWCSPAK